QNTFAGTTQLGARSYDPATGRFLTVDPLLNPGSPQQANGYSYANNNPTSTSDPAGTDPPPVGCANTACYNCLYSNTDCGQSKQVNPPATTTGSGGGGNSGSGGCLPALLPTTSCTPLGHAPAHLPAPPPPPGLLPPTNVAYVDLTPQPPCTGTVLDSVVSCASVPVLGIVSLGRGTSFLGQMLRAGDTKAIRSSAAKGLSTLSRNGVLRDVGRLGRNPIMLRISDGLTIVAGGVQTLDDLNNGSSVGAGVIDGITTAGGGAGGFAVGTEVGLGACIEFGPADLICGGVGGLIGGFVGGSFGHAVGRFLGKMF
ncbi:MAG: hypothetical protein J0H43_00465, partial [Actinobacteria bacterium]|nr:hypothetical protein [Actinomycetota bacterium]